MQNKNINYKALVYLSLFIIYSCREKQVKVEETLKVVVQKQNVDTIPSGMRWVPSGSFGMGSNDPKFTDARPIHSVKLDGFLMDEHEVTNAEYEKFVKETNYITVAERKVNPSDYPEADPSKLVPGSGVFTPPSKSVTLDDPLQWWKFVPGADWRHPTGPGSTINGQPNNPVVHICYEDAIAYCKWCNKRLPTEAEWEYAARGGSNKQTEFYWGNELTPGGKWVANIYQGNFPSTNSGDDGFIGIAPVKSYAPNSYGLYDMEGNVWEWCNDFYKPDYYLHSPVKNPKGPTESNDPDEPNTIKRVQRGGSFLCSDQYCIRYREGSRGKGEVTSGSNNLGFRCVKDSMPDNLTTLSNVDEKAGINKYKYRKSNSLSCCAGAPSRFASEKKSNNKE